MALWIYVITQNVKRSRRHYREMKCILSVLYVVECILRKVLIMQE